VRKGLYMTVKERERLKLVHLIQAGELTYAEGAAQGALSERQLYRSMRRYEQTGDEGLIHQLRGSRSNRHHPLKLRRHVVMLYRQEYSDYGPTLFCEMLLEHHQIDIGIETVRQWLLKASLWQRARKGRKHRKKRPRRAAKGDLVQFDGSHHAWFEDRGPVCCLLVAIDDASGSIMARFAETESTQTVLTFWKEYVHHIGLPKEVYTDRDSVYYHPDHDDPTKEEKDKKRTDYGSAMKDLAIRCIYARSPEAKGRVERMNRTLQDRLLKELRRRKISTIAEANDFLREAFQEKFNIKFALSCSEEGMPLKDHHRRCILTEEELITIFAFRSERSVYKDYTITVDAHWIQLTGAKAPLPLPRTKVRLKRYLDGTVHIFCQGGELAFQPLAKGWTKPMHRQGHPPKEEHPWLHRAPFGKAKRKRLIT
jgi:hypothetical protein